MHFSKSEMTMLRAYLLPKTITEALEETGISKNYGTKLTYKLSAEGHLDSMTKPRTNTKIYSVAEGTISFIRRDNEEYNELSLEVNGEQLDILTLLDRLCSNTFRPSSFSKDLRTAVVYAWARSYAADREKNLTHSISTPDVRKYLVQRLNHEKIVLAEAERLLKLPIWDEFHKTYKRIKTMLPQDVIKFELMMVTKLIESGSWK